MNIFRVKEHLKVVFQTDVVPLLEGATGIGKSELFQQVADELGMVLIDVRMGECGEAADAFGLPTVVADGAERRTIWSKPTWMPREEEMSKPHLLLLDEINRAPDKDTLQTVFKLLLKKQIHERILPATWKVAAAINPDGDDNYYVQSMDLALQTRFITYKVNCDAKCWIDYAYAHKVNQNVIDFISTDNSFLHNEKGKNNPRTWVQLSKLMDRLEQLNKLDMLFEIAEGLLDAATAATFKRFVEGNLAKPVKAADLLSSFAKVKPQLTRYVKENKIDVIYATNTELEHYNAEGLIAGLKNLIDYILFIPPEVGYKLIRGFMEDKDRYAVLFRKLTDDARIMKLVASVDYAE